MPRPSAIVNSPNLLKLFLSAYKALFIDSKYEYKTPKQEKGNSGRLKFSLYGCRKLIMLGGFDGILNEWKEKLKFDLDVEKFKESLMFIRIEHPKGEECLIFLSEHKFLSDLDNDLFDSNSNISSKSSLGSGSQDDAIEELFSSD